MTLSAHHTFVSLSTWFCQVWWDKQQRQDFQVKDKAEGAQQ